MLTHFDHVTFVVGDVDRVREFFALLGFREDKSVVISGAKFADYMGVPGIEAEHVTLVLAGATPRTEIQLLKYRQPRGSGEIPRHGSAGRTRPGFNHICFAVDDIETEIARLRRAGVELLNQIMEFHDRKLVFLAGPEGIIVELSEWRRGAG